ncbi:hypothetical protein C8J57DRAFT_1228854 [Mycena rebaudengoi]|nr:hypothetical protein C8J57DRAFT_1228854 [Mycena rebaudengoi]
MQAPHVTAHLAPISNPPPAPITIMAQRLDAADQAFAQATAERYSKYERLAEHHASVLRSDPETYDQACGTYAAQHGQDTNLFPAAAEWDDTISLNEQVLERTCDSPFDHLMHMNAAQSLMHIHMMKASDQDEKIYLEALRLLGEMRPIQQVIPTFPSLPALPASILAARLALPSRLLDAERIQRTSAPAVLCVSDLFTVESIATRPRTPVSAEALAEYRRHPEPLLGKNFVCDEDGEQKVFKITSILLVSRDEAPERLFYVQYGGEGDESYAFNDTFFFEMLAASEQMRFLVRIRDNTGDNPSATCSDLNCAKYVPIANSASVLRSGEYRCATVLLELHEVKPFRRRE